MAVKRKFSDEFDDAIPTHGKLQKLIPFPSTELDSDVAMSDGSDLEPLYLPIHNTRLQSDASYSSTTTASSPRDSLFDLYPTDGDSDMSAAPSPTQRSVGLLQPKGNSFTHHGQNCTQIPKLRMACSTGPHGRRTMWSHCEECGAIEMVDSD